MTAQEKSGQLLTMKVSYKFSSIRSQGTSDWMGTNESKPILATSIAYQSLKLTSKSKPKLELKQKRGNQESRQLHVMTVNDPRGIWRPQSTKIFVVLNLCVVLCIVGFLSFCVLFVCKCVLYCCHRVFVCKCVLYCCHRVATQLQLTNISYHNDIFLRSSRVFLDLFFVFICYNRGLDLLF
jgi:hypothetical protein